MSALTDEASDPSTLLLDRIEALGVELVRWPDAELGDTLDHEAPPNWPSRPRLYLVEPGSAPPQQWGPFEDWTRLPARPAELLARANTLLNRANAIAAVAQLDETVLRIGDRSIILSTNEASLLRTLLERPWQVVPRCDIEAAIWPDRPRADPRALDNPLKTLRKRLLGAPLHIHAMRGQGLLVELRPNPSDGPVSRVTTASPA